MINNTILKGIAAIGAIVFLALAIQESISAVPDIVGVILLLCAMGVCMSTVILLFFCDKKDIYDSQKA